ncbi:hypothetical protein AXG93_3053s1030 [Marchantia polymorpha subsp. ruderalis]|uniref:Uncharacterized protein n=1 Tax=Marchantia polymorpha subsp. ruderalis TaxID=1480154 RepID=A0A176WUI5_MARPO|nr:hypothetical protein AXG93_3053s1030 [Marchantia polymorpha subsp. ruderalis]
MMQFLVIRASSCPNADLKQYASSSEIEDRRAYLEPLIASKARQEEICVQLPHVDEVVAVRERLVSLDIFRGLAIAVCLRPLELFLFEILF